MATFFGNGAAFTAMKKQQLLRFLRDELHITSVKDGLCDGVPPGGPATSAAS